MGMQFVAKYIGRGKKVRGNQPTYFLHGTRFKLHHKMILGDYFIEQTNLNDPAIRDQVIATLRELYGICITAYETKYEENDTVSVIGNISKPIIEEPEDIEE